ncbi:MAG: type I-E CRISPR-associated protein Cse1/CasA [Nitrospiria bacterium]
MNLIHDAWIPIRRKSGKVERISPSQISEEDIVSLAAPRPDFNGALIQFLIGLLQTTCAPEDKRGWRQWLREPPSQEALQAAFEPVAHAFELDGDGPRFMQDGDLVDGTECYIEQLIIEAPGEDRGLNTDHFIKRGSIHHICVTCTAMAILSMQINGPSGGRGYYPGLRGAGPLTTLVVGNSLWEAIWLNIIENNLFLNNYGNKEKIDQQEKFIWLGKLQHHHGNLKLFSDDLHPHSIFWPMPRRLKILFEKAEEQICDLCGVLADTIAKKYITKTIKYDGPWKHPLSPYRIQQNGNLNAIHPRSGGIGYRHWLWLIFSSQSTNATIEPAQVVSSFLHNRPRNFRPELRLWSFGFDIKPGQAKARCWYDSTMPLLLIGDEFLEEYNYRIQSMIQTAEWACGAVILSFLRATYFQPDLNKKNQIIWKAQKPWRKFEKCDEENIESVTVRESKSILETIRVRFWQETEADFFHFLYRLRDALTANVEALPILEDWRKRLIKEAEVIFDDLSQTGAFEAADPKRIALAWRDLQKSIRGKKVRKILGLPEKQIAKS